MLNDYRLRVAAIIALTLLLFGAWLWVNRNVEATNNAMVRCELVDVVSELSGIVKTINFEDNAKVQHNQVIVTMDDAEYHSLLLKRQAELKLTDIAYRAAKHDESVARIERAGDLDQIELTVLEAQHNLSSTEHAIKEAEANLQGMLADLALADASYQRNQSLFSQNLIAKFELDQSYSELASKRAEKVALAARVNVLNNIYRADTQRLETIKVQHKVLARSLEARLAAAFEALKRAEAAVAVARVDYQLANINFERTKIKALRSGRMTNRQISSGEFIEIGQPIASIVSCEQEAWIEANFKETQIAKMQVGQVAHISLDTYSDITFEGKIVGIAYGSGSTFSVLPPENAVGNFTKVVQRFPVKIAVNDFQGKIFRTGASAYVEVQIKP